MAFIPDSQPSSSEGDQSLKGTLKAGSGFRPDPGSEKIPFTPQAPDLSTSGAANIPDYETFKQDYIKQEEAGPLSRLLQNAMAPVKAVGAIASPIIQGIPGALEQAKEDVSGKSVSDAIKTALGSNVRTGVEAGRRAGFDMLSFPDTLAAKLASFKDKFKATPLRSVLPLTPRTPSEEEIQNAYDRLIEQTAYQESRNLPSNQIIAQDSSFPGKVNEKMANAEAATIPLILPSVGAEERAATVSSLERTPKAVASTIKKPFSNYISKVTPTVTESAMSVLDVPKIEAQELVERSVPKIIESHGKSPINASEAIAASKTAKSYLYGQTIQALKDAEEEGLVMKGQLGLNAVDEEIGKIPTLTSDQATKYVDEYRRFAKDLSPVEGQKLLKRFNEELTAFYQKEGVSEKMARANPEVAAKIAFRDSLSNQLDDLVKAVTGKDQSPYRDLGKVIEFQSNLQKRVSDIESAIASQKTGIDKSSSSIPSTKYTAVKKGIKTIAIPFTKNQMEKLDAEVSKIFRNGPKPQKATALKPETISQLKSIYQPTSREVETVQTALNKNLQILLDSPYFKRANYDTQQALIKAAKRSEATPVSVKKPIPVEENP